MKKASPTRASTPLAFLTADSWLPMPVIRLCLSWRLLNTALFFHPPQGYAVRLPLREETHARLVRRAEGRRQRPVARSRPLDDPPRYVGRAGNRARLF